MTATDPKLIVCEMRAGELLTALQSAVDGTPNWRLRARMLLDDIAALRLPAKAFERLKELDSLRRAAEVMGDITCP